MKVAELLLYIFTISVLSSIFESHVYSFEYKLRTINSTMNNSLIAVAIGVTVGVLSAASIFIYHKILVNQQYGTTISDLDTANKRINELKEELETLRLQLKQQKRKRRISRKSISNDNTHSLTDNDTDIDVFSTDTEFGDDEFYDCSDGESVVSENETRISEELDSILKEIDEQAKEEFDVNTYYKLQKLVAAHQDNVEMVWRFARACYYYAEMQTDLSVRHTIILEGINHCKKLIQIPNADLFKWYAILIGLNGDYLSQADKLKNGIVFKDYITMALTMRHDDFELHYLLGRFKYEIASLSWLQKKLAATLFSEVPKATHEEALSCFEEAVKLGNKSPHLPLYISKCHIALNQYSNANDTLKLILKKPIITSDDEKVHTEASQLLKKYSGYAS